MRPAVTDIVLARLCCAPVQSLTNRYLSQEKGLQRVSETGLDVLVHHIHTVLLHSSSSAIPLTLPL